MASLGMAGQARNPTPASASVSRTLPPARDNVSSPGSEGASVAQFPFGTAHRERHPNTPRPQRAASARLMAAHPSKKPPLTSGA
ncbi:hypothetical protein MRX96_015824 [Rhipicephalus microplus]